MVQVALEVEQLTPMPFAIRYLVGLGMRRGNFVRGFGAWQMDLAVRRNFPSTRNSAYNSEQKPSTSSTMAEFWAVTATYCSLDPRLLVIHCVYVRPSERDAGSKLRVLSSLYQAGGPRSMQFALN